MHISPRSRSTRFQSALCVLAVTVGLTLAPALVSTAEARGSVSSCASAQAALKQAQNRHAAATKSVAVAKKALAKAKKAKAGRANKVKNAKKALSTANRTAVATAKAVKTRQALARSACATPTPNPQAVNTGKKLSLLGVGNGLAVGDLDLGQLTILLEELLPGVTANLNPAQLAGLVGGFNAGPDLDPAAALALLTGVLGTNDVTDLLAGNASPEALSGLLDDVLGQLGALGGLPVPDAFDPAGLWNTFAGLLGALDPSQLGTLLALVTSGLGVDAGNLELGQLTGLIDSLVPGISEQFDGEQLASMLAALNGGGLSAETLSELLGGQFSPAQLLEVINGTAGQDLLGTVIAQVIAQLGTAGGGGLALPGTLDAGAITELIATVTDLIASVLGGGGVLPVVCGLLPLPGLCD